MTLTLAAYEQQLLQAPLYNDASYRELYAMV